MHTWYSQELLKEPGFTSRCCLWPISQLLGHLCNRRCSPQSRQTASPYPKWERLVLRIKLWQLENLQASLVLSWFSGTDIVVQGRASCRAPTLLVKPRFLCSLAHVWPSASLAIFYLVRVHRGARKIHKGFALKMVSNGFISESSHFGGKAGTFCLPLGWANPGLSAE